MNKFIYKGPFIAKPRMTQRDKWKKRPSVEKYFACKDLIKLKAKKEKFSLAPDCNVKVMIPMPKSWSKKKKKEMAGKPHTQKPDVDNLLKSVFDMLLPEDSYVHTVCVQKIWSIHPSVEDYLISIENK